MHRAIGLHELIIAGKDGTIRVFPSQFVLCLQIVRFPPIIRVQKGDELIFCLFNTLITGYRHPGILLVNEADAGILHRLRSRHTTVRRPIIHHDNLKILKSLLQDRLQRLYYLLFLVIERYHYTNHTNNPFFFALRSPNIIP